MPFFDPDTNMLFLAGKVLTFFSLIITLDNRIVNCRSFQTSHTQGVALMSCLTYPATTCKKVHRRRKRGKTGCIVDIKIIWPLMHPLLYLTVCLCRVIQLFSIWKYLTRLHLSLLKVIIQFNWVGYYSSSF